MHNFTGDRAWQDVTADGEVTINGREYAVDSRIVAALQPPATCRHTRS